MLADTEHVRSWPATADSVVGMWSGHDSAVHEDENKRVSARYTLTETENGHVWGVCAEAEGMFRESQRGTYELFGWVPEESGVPTWVGSRVWLVPDDEALDAWLLEDAEGLEQLPGTDSLLLTGMDDYEGPPGGTEGAFACTTGTAGWAPAGNSPVSCRPSRCRPRWSYGGSPRVIS